MSTEQPPRGKPDFNTKINFFDYVTTNNERLQPPVCNIMMHNEGVLRVMIVGGPNKRKDNHLNIGEEFFYQIKGDMNLKIMEENKPKDVIIKEGEVYMNPGRIQHSPQRFENTVGLVIERERKPDELDGVQYFTDDTNQKVLFQKFFYCHNLGTQLKPLIETFFASNEFKTNEPNPKMEPAAWERDSTTKVVAPYVLSTKFPDADTSKKAIKLFDGEFKVYLSGESDAALEQPVSKETWVFQIVGDGEVNGIALGTGDTVLLEGVKSWKVKEGGKCLLIYTDVI